MQPYQNQKKQRGISKASDLTPQEQDLLCRVRHFPTDRQTPAERLWLRTCYQPSSDAAFSRIETHVKQKGGIEPILNDASLYNFGPDWQRIFLRMPQLLESGSADEYEESVKEALDFGIAAEAEDAELAEEDGYDPDEDGLPWPCFYGQYHMALIMGRIYIIDAKTLASEGRNAGKVLAVWYDQCGRVIRSYRQTVDGAADYHYLDDCYLTEHACWANATIGKEYQWGASLGPPYGEDSSEEDEEDEEDVKESKE
jgi:hypothetical protein